MKIRSPGTSSAIIYEHEGDMGRAALATAERSNLEDNPKLALASAQMAMKGIPAGTPDCLRAQDIAMVSATELKKDKKGTRMDKASVEEQAAWHGRSGDCGGHRRRGPHGRAFCFRRSALSRAAGSSARA